MRTEIRIAVAPDYHNIYSNLRSEKPQCISRKSIGKGECWGLKGRLWYMTWGGCKPHAIQNRKITTSQAIKNDGLSLPLTANWRLVWRLKEMCQAQSLSDASSATCSESIRDSFFNVVHSRHLIFRLVLNRANWMGWAGWTENAGFFKDFVGFLGSFKSLGVNSTCISPRSHPDRAEQERHHPRPRRKASSGQNFLHLAHICCWKVQVTRERSLGKRTYIFIAAVPMSASFIR
jgi:hypothetical protein